MARAASELSPTTRTTRPARVLRKAHHKNNASSAPMMKSTLTLSAARTCGKSDQKPSGIAGRSGAEGWMKDFPKKKASPEPNSISAMPIAMSLTRGKEQIQPWNSPKQTPEAAAASTPSQGEPVSTATA
jgi:hypothetical protein